MYSRRSGLILAFHGTDKSVVEDVINDRKPLHYYTNDYDWLGHGSYFWEYSPSRALHFAQLLKKNPKQAKITIKTPAVLGAILDLGKCLDFMDSDNLQLLKQGYEVVKTSFGKNKIPLNESVNGGSDLLLRKRDCLVIETLHQKVVGNKTFDSVRGVFWEGNEVYPTAGFKEKNHIQICIRNPNCIKGYFLPRKIDEGFQEV